MKFRTVVFLSIVALIAGVIAATAVAVAIVINRTARHEVVITIERSQEVFEEVQTLRQTLLRSQSRVVAEEPRLKAVVATEEVDHETILGVAQELRQAVQSDLFLIADGQGRLLADVADPGAEGQDLSGNPLIHNAIKAGESSGIWTEDQAAFQVQARRLNFGATVVGVLVVGFRLDDRTAENAFKQSGSAVVIALNGQIIAASSLEDGSTVDRQVLSQSLSEVLMTASAQREVRIGREHYLALTSPFPNYTGEGDLHYVLLRSLDRALAPGRRLTVILFAILLVGVFVTLVFAVALSRRVSRPIDMLVNFTKEIAGGNLAAQTRVEGPLEVVSLGQAMNRMAHELNTSRAELVRKERLESEMKIAARIQTALLPLNLDVQNLQIAALMLPATEVGGDYYDVIAVPDGCWIGIGDVAGHGLTSGLVMIMVQSVVAALTALTRLELDITPRDVVVGLNRVIFENIRHRLKQDEHVTFCLIRYFHDGRIVFAGAHEDIIICRAATGKCEVLSTPGTWVGGMPDIDRFTVDTHYQLETGDVMVLYTDGITENPNPRKEQFGIDQLIADIEAVQHQPVAKIHEHIMRQVKAWGDQQNDDISLMVLRYQS